MKTIHISGSLMIQTIFGKERYRWKYKNKESIYKKDFKKAIARFTGFNFIEKLRKNDRSYRMVDIKFYKKNDEWFLIINRNEKGNVLLQTYSCESPYLQLSLNRYLPNELWKEYVSYKKNMYTRHINVEINLDEWKDIKLEPSDFLMNVEKDSMNLMRESLKYGFNVDFVSKGRAYDLELISPKGNKFILAISSHVARDKKRNKEKRKQKILMDISKMIYFIYGKKMHPVIISRPLDYDGSWSLTTDNYLNFYKEKFNFNFLTTDFKKGWEKDICNKLLELDNNVQPSRN